MNYQLIPKEKMKLKIAQQIGLDAKDLPLFDVNQNSGNVHLYDLETFSLISDSYHYDLLELIKLPNLSHSTKSLSDALGLEQKTVKSALNRLIKLGLLSKDENGRYINKDEFSSSITKTQTSKAHQNHQKQILETAIVALDNVPVEFRSQSSMTMAIDVKKLPQAREFIKEFRRNLAKFLTDSNDPNDVYNLSVSLFPVTNFHKEEI